MSDPVIIDLLAPFEDTHEIVISRAVEGDGLLAAWRAAVGDAHEAYARWCDRPGPLAHAAYLAAADQVDAAVETLRTERLLDLLAVPV